MSYDLLSFFDKVHEGVIWLWNVMSAPLAIIIYFVLLVAVIVLLIASIMVKERRYTGALKRMKERKQAAAAEKKPEEEEPREPRFCMLNGIDARFHEGAGEEQFAETGLKAFCEEFRAFAAGKLGLYYDISDIRKFVAGMAVSHIVILQGMSGTGKTSLAYAFGQFLDNPSTVIPVQPMWKERTDLIGYYNEFTKRFNETLLLQKMYEANYSARMYITILDEMNIARVEYYFAEFLSLLEIPDPEARYLEVVSDHWRSDPKQLKEGRLKLPGNMWFIGTANNDDSTFAISDKVYDRAMVLDLDRKAEPFHAPAGKCVPISAEQFEALAAEACANYPLSDGGREKLRELDAFLSEKFRVTFGNRIMKQIERFVPVFVAAGGTEEDALDDIVAKKVLRKLETQNAVYIRSNAAALCEKLDAVFGFDVMRVSKECVLRIAANA